MVTRFFRERAPLSAQLGAFHHDVALPRALYAELAELDIFSEALPSCDEANGSSPLVSSLIAEAGARELAPGPWLDQLIAVRVCGADQELVAPLLSAKQIAAVGFPADLSIESRSASGTVDALRFGDKVDRWVLVTDNCAVVVDPAGSGVADMRRERTVDPLWQSVTVTLDGAPVIAEIELSAEERDEAVAYARALAAAASIGAGTRVLEDGITYVTGREQFGRPLGSFQAIKHHASNEFITLLHARCMTRHAFVSATLHDALVARVAADNAYRSVCETVIQMHGGVAFTAAVPVHLFLKNAQQLRVWPTHVEGDFELLREHLSFDTEAAIA